MNKIDLKTNTILYHKMPHKPIDYSKTIIYKIVCKNPEIKHLYVGHTTDITTRKRLHKQDCLRKCKKDRTNYVIINENGGWENWEMTPVEEFPCESSIQARIREEHWRLSLNADMNSFRCYRTEEDKVKDNKESNRLRTIRKHKDDEYRLKCNDVHNKYMREHRETINAREREKKKDPEVRRRINERSRWTRWKRNPYENVLYGSCVFKELLK